MKIIIEFRNNIGLSDRVIRYTLMDALAEFQSNRGPSPAVYVTNRYPWMGIVQAAQKATEVMRRCFLAEEIRNGVMDAREEAYIDFGITDEMWDYRLSELHS